MTSIKNFLSAKSLYILAYNFIPFLGIIFNFYNIYEIAFIYIFETLILCILSAIKAVFLKWKELLAEIPVLILITFWMSLIYYGAIIVFYYRLQEFSFNLLLQYPLKNYVPVLTILIYYAIQEIYWMIKSMKSGTMKKIQTALSSNLDKTEKEILYQSARKEITAPYLRIAIPIFAIVASGLISIPIVFIYALCIRNQTLLQTTSFLDPIFVYPFAFTLCLGKGIYNVLAQKNEGQLQG
jgi:hypothetical protein